jgi:uncharacterized protein with FMN-binding domain
MRSYPEPSSGGHNQQGGQRPTPAAAPQRRKQGASKKLANGLVALSSAAVIAVYAAGYVRTAPAAASFASVSSPAAIVSTVTTPATTVASLVSPTATATTTTASATTAAATTTVAAPVTSSAPSATATATTAAVPTATTQPPATTAASSAYRDGTYTGSGTSRHGGVTVAVVIKNGKIVSATITASNTRYPISRIASLPGEVVAAQSANIDFVSGATDSSMAFQTAVASALDQAQ